MSEKKKNLITALLVVASAVLMVGGLARSEEMTVLQKAIHICMECIGLG